MSDLTNVNWPVVKKVSFWVVTIAGYIALVAGLLFVISPYTGSELINPKTGESCRYDANVASVELVGPLFGYGYGEAEQTVSRDILTQINIAKEMPSIKAILLEIDSPGGNPTAGEEIAAALHSANKPTYALIRGQGVSAAYWAAVGATKIYAHKSSEVGSIGVTASYVDNVEHNIKEGLNYNELSTGRFKNLGDPNKPLSSEEKELIIKDLESLKNIFIDSVAKYRNIPQEDVLALADGSTLLGFAAKEKKLIDEVGTFSDVKSRIEQEIGATAITCW